MFKSNSNKLGTIRPNHYCNGYYAHKGITPMVEICRNDCIQEPKDCTDLSVSPIIETIQEPIIETIQEETIQEETIQEEPLITHEVFEAQETVLDMFDTSINKGECLTVHEIVKNEIKCEKKKKAKMSDVVDMVIAKIRLKKNLVNGWSC
jgi:hypothetical protein